MQIMNIYITDRYRDLKIEEVKLALDFQQKKQEEKEAIKELNEHASEVDVDHFNHMLSKL